MPFLGVGTGFEGQVQVVFSVTHSVCKATVSVFSVTTSVFSAAASAVDPAFDYIYGASHTRARMVAGGDIRSVQHARRRGVAHLHADLRSC